MKLIKKIWYGDLSLVKTFWIVSFIGTGILSVISILIEENLETISEIGAFFSLIFLIFFFLYVIYSYVAVWRSATKYTNKVKKKKKSAFWAYAAKTVVVLGVIRGSVEIIKIIF